MKKTSRTHQNHTSLNIGLLRLGIMGIICLNLGAGIQHQSITKKHYLFSILLINDAFFGCMNYVQ